MRFLVKITIPVEVGNAHIKDGSLPRIIQSIMEAQKPEAAYFCAVDGQRTAFLVVNATEPSELPSLAEPWWLSLNADFEAYPAMTPADLAKSGTEDLGKRFG